MATLNASGSTARPWEKSYPKGASWGEPVETTTVTRLFDEAVASFASRDAILFCGRRYGFAWIAHEVRRLATALMAGGLGGERSALLLPNAPFHPVAFFAVLKAGGMVVHLSTFDAEQQILHKLSDSGATVIFTTDDPELLSKARAAAERAGAKRIVVFQEAAWGRDVAHPEVAEDEIARTYGSFVAEIEGPVPFPEVTSEQVALIQYTGGTTGLPKGAVITHANITTALASYRRWFASAEGIGPEIVICALPITHVYGLVTIFLRSFLAGALVSLHYRFKVDKVLREIAEFKVTTLPAVPTIWKEIVDFPGVGDMDLSSLLMCSAGGAPLPTGLSDRVERLTGQFMRGGWGMTETLAAGTNRPATGLRKPGSVGIPLPGFDVQVVSLDDGEPLAADAVGEIRVRGPNVISGYLHQRESESFADGWFRTGDLGYMDADGFIFLVGRRKEMIIVNGLNVYPLIVEQAISEHPKVDEVIVVGMPDERRGEAVGAFVTLRPGSEPLRLEELRDHLGNRLGKHELPTSLSIRRALPKTSVGKLSRRDLMGELGLSPIQTATHGWSG